MSNDKPEQYWIGRGSDVIADLTLDQVLQSRQAETYRALCAALIQRGVTQVVDLGCNTGAVGRFLFFDAKYQGSYIGVDSNPNAVKRAEQNFADNTQEVTFKTVNIRELPYSENSIECVTMKDVLEHMEDFRPCLEEAARIANRFLVVANFICWEQLPPIVSKQEGGFYHNRYNKRAVLDFLETFGWEVGDYQQVQVSETEMNEVYVFVQGGN